MAYFLETGHDRQLSTVPRSDTHYELKMTPFIFSGDDSLVTISYRWDLSTDIIVNTIRSYSTVSQLGVNKDNFTVESYRSVMRTTKY